MAQQIETKTVVIEGREYAVRVFESAESVASRKGRKAAMRKTNADNFERRAEQMAEAAYVNGVHPLSERY